MKLNYTTLRLTEQQYRAIKGKRREERKPIPLVRDPFEGMNKTEARYAQILEARKASREILDWQFEPFSLRLAKATFYKPDFLIVTKSHFEIHEIKGGRIWDDAKVKFKVAAEIFPWFLFRMMQYKGREWRQIL